MGLSTPWNPSIHSSIHYLYRFLKGRSQIRWWHERMSSTDKHVLAFSGCGDPPCPVMFLLLLCVHPSSSRTFFSSLLHRKTPIGMRKKWVFVPFFWALKAFYGVHSAEMWLIWRKTRAKKIMLTVCVSMMHQEPQNGGLTARLSALPEDVGKSPARKRWGFYSFPGVSWGVFGFCKYCLSFCSYRESKWNLFFSWNRNSYTLPRIIVLLDHNVSKPPSPTFIIPF